MTPQPMDTPHELDLEKEVERIQQTAQKQLISVHGLNVSLVKKIRKSEAQAATLLSENKDLEQKNASLVAQLGRAQDDVRALSLKEARLTEVEHKLQQANSAVVAAELAVKKNEARYDGAVAERDALEQELSSVKLKLDQNSQELVRVQQQAREEKEALDTEVQQRGLALATVEKERDDRLRERDDAAETIKARDADLEKVNANVLLVTQEMEQAIADGDARVKDVEDRLAVVTANAETVSKELEDVKEQHEAKIAEAEKQIADAKEDLERLEKEKEDVKAELDAKVTEADELNTRFIALGTERDELAKNKEELDQIVENSQRDIDDSKAALEERDLKFATLESEMNSLQGQTNLLQSEKSSLEKDYTEVRDRSTALDKEKAGLEMRVLELEEIERKLLANVDTLEKERLALIAAHQKELHDQILKKDEEFADQHAELRKELDDVVERHAALRRAEMERDEKQFPETIEMAAPLGAGAGAAAAGRSPAEAAETPGIVAEDVTMDRAMALEPPSDIPDAPVPIIEEPTAKVTPSGEMVMVREKVDDGVPEAPEAPDIVPEAPMAPTRGPGEGDTSGIVSEEVMEEMVVDERETGDDVLEEVDEEEPVDATTAADALKIAAAKGGEAVATAGDKVVDGVTDAVNVTGEKAGEAATGVTDAGKAGVTFAADAGKTGADAGVKAGEKAADAGAKVADAGVKGAKATTAAATGAATDTGAKSKSTAGAIWSKMTACCAAPSKTVGEDTTSGTTTSASAK